jgi:hypothetical protein
VEKWIHQRSVAEVGLFSTESREVSHGRLATAGVCEAEQSTEVDGVVALVTKVIEGDIRRIAKALVLKRDDELLEPGEFDLRKRVLRLACHMLEVMVNDRKKGGTKVLGHSVRKVKRR